MLVMTHHDAAQRNIFGHLLAVHPAPTHTDELRRMTD